MAWAFFASFLSLIFLGCKIQTLPFSSLEDVTMKLNEIEYEKVSSTLGTTVMSSGSESHRFLFPVN